MVQVCDPPRQRQVRRLSAEEFFTLVRCGGVGFTVLVPRYCGC